ncbi:MAG: prepilin-type N-terminal cleavage/methylation domain-containing protein [Phycisphaerae bacterium]|nr:prepilin-type N-terminal cleavage/methylation domain-containing protein [Phycisphaerae bacterium]
MIKKRRQFVAGFTLVELMVALIVTSVVLSAVATLAYATCSAKEATDDMGREQAQLRQVSIRLSDLIKRSNQILRSYDWGFVLWQDKDADGNRDHGEHVIVYRYYEASANTYIIAVRPLTEYEACSYNSDRFFIWKDSDFDGSYDWGERIRIVYTVWAPNAKDTSTELYKQCTNSEFQYDTRTVAIWFDMDDNGQTQRYSINADLRLSDDY